MQCSNEQGVDHGEQRPQARGQDQKARCAHAAQGAGLCATLDRAALPLLPGVRDLAERGFVTGASGRNWAGYGAQVRLPEDADATDRALLTDPQTSGGLLVACAPDAVDAVLACFRERGFAHAAVIGEMGPGQGVTVR